MTLNFRLPCAGIRRAPAHLAVKLHFKSGSLNKFLNDLLYFLSKIKNVFIYLFLKQTNKQTSLPE